MTVIVVPRPAHDPHRRLQARTPAAACADSEELALTLLAWIIIIFFAFVLLAFIVGTPSGDVPRKDPHKMRGSVNRGGN
jgi:hypothetical protein